MHRDTKIGLAMAIVLIGFAAALCLPRPPEEDLAALRLPTAEKLDAEISQLPVKVYTGVEHPDLAGRRPPVIVTTGPSQPGVDEEPGPSDAPVRAKPERRAASPPNAKPAPTIPVAVAADTTMIPIDRWTPDDAPMPPRPDAPQEIVHVVQSGDTLSGIAQKYLGSIGRYPEIFEANRDQLASPDALQLGMRLRIPASGSAPRSNRGRAGDDWSDRPLVPRQSARSGAPL